jgi:hypothetical protein
MPLIFIINIWNISFLFAFFLINGGDLYLPFPYWHLWVLPNIRLGSSSCCFSHRLTGYLNMQGFQIETRDKIFKAGFEVLIAVVMKSTFFWDITPFSPLKVNRRFGETYGLHLQGRIS